VSLSTHLGHCVTIAVSEFAAIGGVSLYCSRLNIYIYIYIYMRVYMFDDLNVYTFKSSNIYTLLLGLRTQTDILEDYLAEKHNCHT